jgi:hypothetical protein
MLNYAKSLGIKLYPILLREPEEFSIFTLDYTKILLALDSYIEIYRKEKNLYVFNLIMKISKKLEKKDLLSRISTLDQLQKDL